MRAIVLDERDNVATAVVDISAGEVVEVQIRDEKSKVQVVESIPFGFKFSIREIPKGEGIFKYGLVIGRSTCAIQSGVMVHSHNVLSSI